VRRLLTVVAIAGVMLVALASPAFAHVVIEPSSAPAGSDAVLTFVVPNEMDNATSTKLVVQFPQDHPIADAVVQPVPGWTFEVKTKKFTTPISTDSGNVDEGVDTVTWTATGTGIGVGEFQQFPVSVGLPDVEGDLLFPAVQTYSNGKTVSWIEQTPPGGQEPENPSPHVTLTKGSDTGGSAAATTPTSSSSSSDDSAKTIAIIGLVVGALGLIIAIIAIVAARRKPSTT
jgi:uncharacterized protein